MIKFQYELHNDLFDGLSETTLFCTDLVWYTNYFYDKKTGFTIRAALQIIGFGVTIFVTHTKGKTK